MSGFFDWIIEQATWAKEDTGTFLAYLGLFLTLLTALVAAVRRRFMGRFYAAIERNEQLEVENKALTGKLTSANERLDGVDPVKVIRKLRQAEESKDSYALFQVSAGYFGYQREIIPVVARILARTRIEEITEDGEAALADAERYLTVGHAADPHDYETATLLEEVRAQREDCTRGDSEATLLFGSATDLTALRRAYSRLRRNGKFALAIIVAEKALDLSMTHRGPRHQETGTDHHHLGALLREQGRYAEAEQHLLSARSIREAAGTKPESLAQTLNSLSVLYSALGRYKDAEMLLQQAYEVIKDAKGSGSVTRVNNLAALLHSLGRHEEAEKLYRRVIEIQEGINGQKDPEYPLGLSNLAVLLNEMGRHTEAERLLRQAMMIDKRTSGENHPSYARHLSNLGCVLHGASRHAEAEPLLRQAIEIKKATLGEAHPDYAAGLNNLASLLRDMGRHAEARPLFAKMIPILRKALGDEQPDTKTCAANYARFLRAHFPNDSALAELEAAFGPEIGR